MIKTALHKSLRWFGFDIVHSPPREQATHPDFRDDEAGIIREVRPWTLTSVERIYALIQAVRYISANSIEGAIVECGVWKGGSMAAVARTLLQMGDMSRDLYLFDTFQGMTQPSPKDVDYSGAPASKVLLDDPGSKCEAPLEQVREMLYASGYPKDRFHFVKGRVEETIPASAPEKISLLRLDTDWYASTKHELVHLFPRLVRAGVLIIDDYGHWRGSREACDEYFEQNRIPMLLNRIDYTGRIGTKLETMAGARGEA
jgi:O-methyltransferase